MAYVLLCLLAVLLEGFAMIKKRTHIVIESHEDHTDLHVGRFIHETVIGPNHEIKARELLPMLINELDFYEAQEASAKVTKKKRVILKVVK